MKNKKNSNGSLKETELKISEISESPSTGYQKNEIKLSYYIRLRTLFWQWWVLLQYTTCVYLYAYFTSKIINSLLKRSIRITNFTGDEGTLYEIVGYSTIVFFSIIKGFTFCADGFVSSLLKTPFGQICYAINKSGVNDDFADKLVNKITEINENFKETFKKFGILNASEEVISVTSAFLSHFKKKEIPSWEEYSKSSQKIIKAAMHTSSFWSISFLVPIGYSFLIIADVRKSIYNEIVPIFNEKDSK